MLGGWCRGSPYEVPTSQHGRQVRLLEDTGSAPGVIG